MFVVLMSELRRLNSDDRGIFTRMIETVLKWIKNMAFVFITAFLNLSCVSIPLIVRRAWMEKLG